MASREEYKAGAICLCEFECVEECGKSQVMTIDLIFNDFENRTCGSCSVINCEILNAIANTGTVRLVDFGCNRWEDINAN